MNEEMFGKPYLACLQLNWSTFHFHDSDIWRAFQWCIVCSYDKGLSEHKQTIAIYNDVIITHNGQLTAWVTDNIALANTYALSFNCTEV